MLINPNISFRPVIPVRTNMDNLVMGSFILNKKDQPEFRGDVDWQKEFELD